MNARELPKATRTAITLSISAMLAPLAIPQAQIDGALSAMFSELDGSGTRSITNAEPLDRVLSAAQVASLLGRSKKTVTELGKRGKIRAVRFGTNGQRASGYSEESVRNFIAETKGGER